MRNLSNDIFAEKPHDRASQRRLLARCCMNPQRRQAEVKKPVLRLPMRVNTISKVVNKYLSADWAAGVGWRVPKRCPLSVGVHPRAGVKRTRASVRRVRLNSDCGSRQVVCETNFFPVLPNEGFMLPNAAWWGGAAWRMVENGVLECARANESGIESRQLVCGTIFARCGRSKDSPCPLRHVGFWVMVRCWETRAKVRRVRRNADAKVVNHFFREKWQRQAAAGSVWQWHPSVSGLGRKRGVMVAAMPVNPRSDVQTNDECAVRTA